MVAKQYSLCHGFLCRKAAIHGKRINLPDYENHTVQDHEVGFFKQTLLGLARFLPDWLAQIYLFWGRTYLLELGRGLPGYLLELGRQVMNTAEPGGIGNFADG